MGFPVKMEVKELKDKSGITYTSIAQFNDNFSHICVDDHCYTLVNGNDELGYKKSYHLFDEAIKVLKQLPDSPNDYEPYKSFYNLK